MGISAYQIDKVIQAYGKQIRLKFRLGTDSAPSSDRYADMVTFSGSEGLAAEACNKISYNLVDVILKDKNKAM